MNNDVFVHANGLIERFKQNAESAAAQGEWTAAQTWYNAVSIVQEPETNAEILKQYPTVKLPAAVEFKHIAQGEWQYNYCESNGHCDIWCTHCGKDATYFVDSCDGIHWSNIEPHYCPYCGADMRKKANDER